MPPVPSTEPNSGSAIWGDRESVKIKRKHGIDLWIAHDKTFGHITFSFTLQTFHSNYLNSIPFVYLCLCLCLCVCVYLCWHFQPVHSKYFPSFISHRIQRTDSIRIHSFNHIYFKLLLPVSQKQQFLVLTFYLDHRSSHHLFVSENYIFCVIFINEFFLWWILSDIFHSILFYIIFYNFLFYNFYLKST